MKCSGYILEDKPTELGRGLLSRFAGESDGKRESEMTSNFGENNLVDGGVIN